MSFMDLIANLVLATHCFLSPSLHMFWNGTQCIDVSYFQIIDMLEVVLFFVILMNIVNYISKYNKYLNEKTSLKLVQILFILLADGAVHVALSLLVTLGHILVNRSRTKYTYLYAADGDLFFWNVYFSFRDVENIEHGSSMMVFRFYGISN